MSDAIETTTEQPRAPRAQAPSVWAATAAAVETYHRDEQRRHELAGREPDPALLARRGSRYSRASADDLYERRGPVAVVDVRGLIVRGRTDFWDRYFGRVGMGDVHDGLRAAVEDESVSSIVLAIDSPGGIAIGLEGLRSDVLKARESKPVHAHISGQGASAAYYLAAAAETVTADPDALVGSIGTYAVAVDSTELHERIGLRVHVVRSGPHKGAGVPGAPITDEHLAQRQQVVDALAENFIAAVAEGRGMTPEAAAQLATGADWIARTAKGLGLIDALGDLDSTIAGLSGGNRSKRRTPAMSVTTDGAAQAQTQTGPKPATLAQLQGDQSIRAAGSDFVLEQLSQGATLEQAKIAAAELRAERAEAKAAEAEAKAKAAAEEAEQNARSASTTTPPPVSGVDPLPTATGPAPDGVLVQGGDFVARARAIAEEKGISVTAAMSKLAQSHPELHREYVNRQADWAAENRGKRHR